MWPFRKETSLSLSDFKELLRLIDDRKEKKQKDDFIDSYKRMKEFENMIADNVLADQPEGEGTESLEKIFLKDMLIPKIMGKGQPTNTDNSEQNKGDIKQQKKQDIDIDHLAQEIRSKSPKWLIKKLQTAPKEEAIRNIMNHGLNEQQAEAIYQKLIS